MDKFWPACVSQLRERFEQNVFDAFIASTEARRDGAGRLTVLAPNDAAARWLAQNVRAPVQTLAQQHFGEKLEVCFRTEPPKTAATVPVAARTKVNRTTNLRADLTFENFMPGRANEIALVAARAISSGNADHISPLLLLYGRTGMGKTHLSQAIANHYLSLYPDRNVRYIMARDFMSDVVNSCRLNRHDQFKRRYSGLDLLIVDDIQYIGGNMERTQEEFFFLFNRLTDENKIIIITSDRAPAQISGLPERLTSRLRCGLPAHLAPPETELREAILRQKSGLYGVTLDDKVIRYIAEKIKSNVRELEGALRRVLATSKFLAKPPSLEMCQEALADLLDSTRESVNVDAIKKQVADFYHLRVSDLSSRSRRQSVVRPRHMAMYLCRQLTNISLPEIGSHFGDREHSTVLHSCRTVEKKLQTNSQTQEEFRILEMLIKS